jgi:uncharacterized membrane protein YheB (UPF0754 family)
MQIHRDFILTYITMNWWLFLVPLSGAITGWLVIRLLFLAIFKPYQPTNIFGIKVQGILPMQQHAISTRVAALVSERFFSPALLSEKISDPANFKKIMPLVETHIDDFLRNKLKKEMPVISMFVGDKTINSLKEVFMKELETLFPQLMRDYASNMINDLNIGGLVYNKLSSISIPELEKSFLEQFSKQLLTLQLLAAFIGVLIGTITVFIVLMVK